jgi:hypothetical protein
LVNDGRGWRLPTAKAGTYKGLSKIAHWPVLFLGLFLELLLELGVDSKIEIGGAL